MKNARHKLAAAALALALLPIAAAAQGFSRQGVFGCSGSGADSMSAELTSALGGSFVPVSDAAVTRNTGYLVYKECVLRGIINRMSENATANLMSRTVEQFETGREGGAMYPRNLAEEKIAWSDEVVNTALDGDQLNAVNPLFRDDVKQFVGNSYFRQTRAPADSLACSFAGTPAELDAILNGRGTRGGADVRVLTDPNCIPLYSSLRAQDLVMSEVAANEENRLTRLSWNRGVYDVETVNPDGTRSVVTPGFIVADTLTQQLGSSFRRIENANDIDEMLVSQTFGILSNIILSEALNGLSGLMYRSGGQPSYLEQIAKETNAGLRDSAVNAGLQILVAARDVESAYLDAEGKTAAVLLRQSAELRGAEAACWNLIIPKVTEYAGGGACAESGSCGGGTLTIATSTERSQKIIDERIAPLATSTAARIKEANKALESIEALIERVANSGAPETQTAALQELDAMVARKEIHNQYDLSAAQKQLQDIESGVGDLVSETIKTWGDSMAVDFGWCNVNNPDVVKFWANQWKQ